MQRQKHKVVVVVVVVTCWRESIAECPAACCSCCCSCISCCWTTCCLCCGLLWCWWQHWWSSVAMAPAAAAAQPPVFDGRLGTDDDDWAASFTYITMSANDINETNRNRQTEAHFNGAHHKSCMICSQYVWLTIKQICFESGRLTMSDH